MDLLLIVVTLGALALALGASVVAWRASHAEKTRAAARVAALSVAAGVPTALEAGQSKPVAFSVPPSRAGEVLTVDGRTHTAGASAPSARGLDTFSGDAEAPAVVLPGAFLGSGAPARESAGRQRWLAVAAAIFAVLLGGSVYSRIGNNGGDAAARAAAPTAPLELLSLGHRREGNNLAVTGLVRNPPTGTAVARVSAVVFLFDQQGTFVASAKAPLDYVTLSGGDESPFVIKVQASQSVARYRVSFRSDDATLPHVDRRGEPPVTTPVALTRQ
jgi:hypothetical protein